MPLVAAHHARRAPNRKTPLVTDVLSSSPEQLLPDAELRGLLEALRAEHHVPGAAVGVIHGDRTYAVCSGVTSTTDPSDVTADTLFFIGSTTKTMTGTVVMRLGDEGRLRLSDRVVDHVPELRLLDESARAAVTVAHLLNHTAGWRGDAVADLGWGDDALARGLDSIVAEMPQLFPPGAMTSYNNAALVLAGRLVEKVTALTYEDAVRTMLFEPLGMSDTYFLPWEVWSRPLAVGHIVQGGVAEPYYGWPLFRAINPAGGAISTIRDQLRYARYHLDGTAIGAPPITDASRLLMQQATASMRSGLTGVGITWLLQRHGDLRLVTHGGNASGLYLSSFVLAPDERFAVTVLTNGTGGGPLGRAVVDWAIQHFLDRPARPALPTLELTPSLLRDYVGRYDAGMWNLEISHEDGRLLLRQVAHDADDAAALGGGVPTEIVLVGPDQVASRDAATEIAGDFVRDDRGVVRWLRYGLRLARRLEV